MLHDGTYVPDPPKRSRLLSVLFFGFWFAAGLGLAFGAAILTVEVSAATEGPEAGNRP